ncbi:hypothetical protein [Streptomyces diastaticus]|uniref:hypothetical protein n=1 Tax=Streptomyces diastaticus TaxID=1956 RepID=UPI003647184D
MSDEQEQDSGNVEIIYDYLYVCMQCAGASRDKPVEDKEQAEGDRAKHRKDHHSDMRPYPSGDEIVEREIGRRVVPEKEEAASASQSSSDFPYGLIFCIILVIGFLASK